MCKKKYLVISYAFCMALSLKAQQLPFFTQYRVNSFLFNPAITGTKQNIDVRVGYRMQWVGYDGAPTTSLASFHSRFYKGAIGLGGFVMKDAIGPNQQMHTNLSAAYHIRFPDVELSVGVAGYFTKYSLDGTKMTLHNGIDPSINQTITTSTWSKNAGAGLYLYNDRFNLGLSATHYLESDIKVFSEDTTKKGLVNYVTSSNLLFGYNYSNSDDYMCENNFYANYVVGAPILLDYTFRFHYKKMLMLGASLRLRNAVAIHLGYTFLKCLQLNYSYDFNINKLMVYNTGTHEVSLVYSYNLSVTKNRFMKQKFQYMF